MRLVIWRFPRWHGKRIWMDDTAPDLVSLHRDAWQMLCAAAKSRDAPLRCLTLATMDRQQQPHLRSIILRDVLPGAVEMEFHTDTRSAKWAQIKINPKVSVLGYDAAQQLQLRLSGKATLLGPRTALQEAAWDALKPWSRAAYCGEAPGAPLDAPDMTGPADTPPGHFETAKGQQRFGVIYFKATQLDWYRHGRGNNMRAIFDYDANGVLEGHRWVAP